MLADVGATDAPSPDERPAIGVASSTSATDGRSTGNTHRGYGDRRRWPSSSRCTPTWSASRRYGFQWRWLPAAPHGSRPVGHGRRLDHILVTHDWDVVDAGVV